MRRDKELSDGDLHPVEAWNWLTDQLYERFEAWTLAPGFYHGVWKSPKTGQPISDNSRRYIVALPPGRFDDLRRLLADACAVFRQQCIYLSIAGQVEFVEASSDGPAENLRGPEGS
jgi:hypothetical protein